MASNAKFIGDITSTSAFNLHEVNSIDLEFFGIKAAGKAMTKLLIGMVIVTYFARFNKSGKTTLFPPVVYVGKTIEKSNLTLLEVFLVLLAVVNAGCQTQSNK